MTWAALAFVLALNVLTAVLCRRTMAYARQAEAAALRAEAAWAEVDRLRALRRHANTPDPPSWQ